MPKYIVIPPTTSTKKPQPTVAIRREKIAHDLADFLARGGKIEQVPIARSKYNPEPSQ